VNLVWRLGYGELPVPREQGRGILGLREMIPLSNTPIEFPNMVGKNEIAFYSLFHFKNQYKPRMLKIFRFLRKPVPCILERISKMAAIKFGFWYSAAMFTGR
jgi:hypothetical protein